MADVTADTPEAVSADKAPAASGPETTNKFQHAISAWRSEIPRADAMGIARCGSNGLQMST